MLPLVDSLLPLNLEVDSSVKPTVVHKPTQVPLHFMEEVREGLEKDVCFGFLEKVPENTAITWCSRMCVVTKKNGLPCHTVDFHAVNNAAPRQMHPVFSPFLQACIAEGDRHITTFITPWGKFHYKFLPQGFLMDNDVYCQWYDKIT